MFPPEALQELTLKHVCKKVGRFQALIETAAAEVEEMEAAGSTGGAGGSEAAGSPGPAAVATPTSSAKKRKLRVDLSDCSVPDELKR